MLGIGIDTSIATADEVETAIAKQEAPQQVAAASEPEKEETLFEKSVNYIKTASNKREAYSQVVTKYGDKFSEKQVLALEKFVKW